jgi:DHA1 family multidrug resistance protein-like MFS transporter
VIGSRSVLPLAMFFGSFSWSFVLVSLPFHIQRLSTMDAAATLTWTGWILGVSPLVTVITAPFWGRFADRSDPKMLYVVTQLLQGLAFVSMAIARTLPELFLSRFVLGLMGASSTFAFIGAGRSDDPAATRREVSAIQSGMTVGQVIGPLVGAITAARLGFRPSFVLGGVVLLGCGALVHWGLPAPAEASEVRRRHGDATPAEVVAVALVVLGGSTQIFFLTAILPQILPALGIAGDQTLEVGGILIFVSGAAAAAGAMAAPRLGDLRHQARLLATLLLLSSLFVAGLGIVSSVWSYGLLRFLQVLCIAPVFPLIVARIALRASGAAIGFINSARIGAAFVGPVLATTMLGWSSPAALYVMLALVGIACAPLARMRGRTPAPWLV